MGRFWTWHDPCGFSWLKNLQEDLWLFQKYSNCIWVNPYILLDTLNMSFTCLEASETNERNIIIASSKEPIFEKYEFFKFWSNNLYEKSGFSLLEKLQEDLWLFRTYSTCIWTNLDNYTPKYLEHVICMPRGFEKNRKINIIIVSSRESLKVWIEILTWHFVLQKWHILPENLSGRSRIISKVF